jgi:hypothetical protein
MTNLKIGKVTHFYDKIGVCVIELAADLGVGDVIKFVRGGEDLFEQKVDSLQIEHEKVKHAKSGEIVGLKTKKPVKEGADVFRMQPT